MKTQTPQRRVLIADNDESIVADITRTLNERGRFDISTATTGQSAIQELHRLCFDLLILDEHLTNVDGQSMMREAKEHSPQAIVVLLTMTDTNEAKVSTDQTVVHHYLTKPIAIAELASILESVFPAPAPRPKVESIVLKIILGGDANVGKTSLIQRYTTGKFEPGRLMTIGVDFHLYEMQIENTPLRLVVWDLGGQERFSFARKAFYRGTQAVGLIFDASNRTSFYNLMRWWHETREYLPNVPVILLANKIDLPRQVSGDETLQIARAWKMPFYESSCANGNGVAVFFEALATQAWKYSQKNSPPSK